MQKEAPSFLRQITDASWSGKGASIETISKPMNHPLQIWFCAPCSKETFFLLAVVWGNNLVFCCMKSILNSLFQKHRDKTFPPNHFIQFGKMALSFRTVQNVWYLTENIDSHYIIFSSFWTVLIFQMLLRSLFFISTLSLCRIGRTGT